MAKQILQRYGTAADLNPITGTAGTNREIALVVDGSGIATGQIRVMDGVTNGGRIISHDSGRMNFLGRVDSTITVDTYTTTLVYGDSVELPVIPVTNNKILIECCVYGEIEKNSNGGAWIFCLASGSESPSVYAGSDAISNANFSTLINSNNHYHEYSINPTGTGITEENNWEMALLLNSSFLFDGSSELTQGEKLYFYFAFLNRTSGGGFTKVKGRIAHITLYEIIL